MSYDPTAPHAPAITGAYAARAILSLTNDLGARHDTIASTLILRDSAYRGRFYGTYRFASGESERAAGTLYPTNTIVLTHLGPWPPLSRVPTLRQLYPACAFERLQPIHLVGALRGDTLAVAGQGLVPCVDQAGAAEERATLLEFELLAIRL